MTFQLQLMWEFYLWTSTLEALNLQPEYPISVGKYFRPKDWASFISAEIVVTEQPKTDSSNHPAFYARE